MKKTQALCVVTAAAATLAMSLPAQAQTAKATLKDAQGKEVGQVQLVQATNGVLLRMTLKGAPAGAPFRVMRSSTPLVACTSWTCPTSLPCASFSVALAVCACAGRDIARVAAAAVTTQRA